MIRSCILCLWVFAVILGSTAPLAANGPISLLQVLQAIEAASKDRTAQTMLGTYVKAAIEGAVAAGKQSGAPVICAAPGKGRFDAREFAVFAKTQKPTKAAQARTAATPILITFVMRQNPCS